MAEKKRKRHGVLVTESGGTRKHRNEAASFARLIIATTVGNALEWLDFSAYALFAVFIAREFFPADSELASLLAVFGTFAVGFVMRPVGALLLGGYADRAGRRAALSLTILLMALGTAIIAFTPGYGAIAPPRPFLSFWPACFRGFRRAARSEARYLS